MRDVSYMQNSNGRITVFCEQLPDKGFIDAEKVRNVCSIRVKTRGEKLQAGRPGNDVDVLYATGEREVISRTQLAKEFRHSNGKKIVIQTLRNGQKYLATRNMSGKEAYKVLKLPDNCTGSLRGNPVSSGTYLVCKANDDGSPNKDTMYTVSPKMFRKMFKVPMQAVIKRHLHKPSNRQFGLFNPRRLAEVRGRAPRNHMGEFDMFENNTPHVRADSIPRSINLGTGLHTAMGNSQSPVVPVTPMNRTPVSPNNMQRPANNMQRQAPQNIRRPINQNVMQQHVVNTQSTPGAEQHKKNPYKYTITHRIVSMTNNALIGFVVKEISSGQSKQLTTLQVHQLCEQKLVDNVMMVRKDNGVKFLKGNNMRIENLPQVLA